MIGLESNTHVNLGVSSIKGREKEENHGDVKGRRRLRREG